MTQNIRAYVVDDSQEFNVLLKKYLKDLGVELTAFTELKEFLWTFRLGGAYRQRGRKHGQKCAVRPCSD